MPTTTPSWTPTPAYLWFDTEFTSLEASQARLLQVALLVTDIHLNRLTPPEDDLNICIALEPDAPVSGWVEENLADLLLQCRSEAAIPVADADRQLAAQVDKAIGPAAKDIADRPVLAGNAVHMDLLMARLFLPEFEKRLHYRLLDVSTLKILWNDTHPDQPFDKDAPGVVAANLPPDVAPPAGEAHDAYYDIHASLAEMNYYRTRLLA
jgi:oligoribonuclease